MAADAPQDRRPGGDTEAVARLSRPLSDADVPPRPARVRWVVRLLLVGAGLALLEPLGLVGVDVAAYVLAADPTGAVDPATADRLAAVSAVVLVAWSLVVAAVWALHARALGRGRPWVRASASLLALAGVLVEWQELQSPYSTTQVVLSVLTLLVVPAVVVLIWGRSVTEWLRAVQRADRS